MSTKFWIVWSPRGGQPRYKHESLDKALAEAQRLSEKFPGRHFYVLELVYTQINGPEIPTAKQAARAAAAAAKEAGAEQCIS